MSLSFLLWTFSHEIGNRHNFCLSLWSLFWSRNLNGLRIIKPLVFKWVPYKPSFHCLHEANQPASGFHSTFYNKSPIHIHNRSNVNGENSTQLKSPRTEEAKKPKRVVMKIFLTLKQDWCVYQISLRMNSPGCITLCFIALRLGLVILFLFFFLQKLAGLLLMLKTNLVHVLYQWTEICYQCHYNAFYWQTRHQTQHNTKKGPTLLQQNA